MGFSYNIDPLPLVVMFKAAAACRLISEFSLCLSPSTNSVKTGPGHVQLRKTRSKVKKGHKVPNFTGSHLCFKDPLAPENFHRAEEFDPGDCAVWIKGSLQSIRGMCGGHGTKACPTVERWA